MLVSSRNLPQVYGQQPTSKDEIQKPQTHVLEPYGDSSSHGMQFLFWLIHVAAAHRFHNQGNAIALSSGKDETDVPISLSIALSQQASS